MSKNSHSLHDHGTSSNASSAPAASEAERRVWVRYPCDVSANCQPVKAADRLDMPALVCNVSRGGIGLQTRRRFERGVLLRLELPSQEPGHGNSILAYVVHISPAPNGEWLLGCRFASELEDEELIAFGAVRLPAAKDDRRAWMRFPCKVKARYELVQSQALSPDDATVLDISPGGVSLMVEQEIEVGTLLHVQLRGDNDGSPLTILVAVVRASRHTDTSFALACNFIRELESAELEALLGT